MFSRLPSIIRQINFSANYLANHYVNQNLGSLNRRVELLEVMRTPVVTQIRGFRDKEILKLRCRDCYFKKVDDRWWVLCKSHPRHKQREQVDDVRRKWIVTHITRTGYPFRKHYQYPYHDL